MSNVTSGLGAVATGGLSMVPGSGRIGEEINNIQNFDLANSLGMKNKYQTALDPEQQRQLAAAIIQSQQNMQSIYGQQNQLAGDLRQIAQGQGPNPAQLMLNQATNKNIAQNAGQLGSVRGINPALAGRMLSQNAGQMNQQAAGQGALMQAQQQLSAQSALANLYGNMGQQQLGGVQAYGGVLNPTQQINAGIAQGNANQTTQLAGGVASGAGAALAGHAHGGMIEKYSSGGSVEPMSGPKSHVGKFLSGLFENQMNCGGTVNMKSGGAVPGKEVVPGDSPANDIVPVMASAGEIVIPKSIVMGPNAAKMAAIFVQRELNKRQKGK